MKKKIALLIGAMCGILLIMTIKPLFASAELYYEDVEQFPESYQDALYELKEKHPNWTFVLYPTELKWDTVLYNQMNPANRSLVPSYFDSSLAGAYYGDGWSIATEKAVEYYMDPRNWLTEDYIFQFEMLSYNASTQGIATVQKVLSNTFMSGYIEGYESIGLTYAQAFRDIGEYLGVSPVHLAVRVYQEQGVYGTSELISGVYPGYEGYYNYYNIQASGATRQEIVTNGLTEAKAEGWDSRYAALLGGSTKVANKYILRGQNTLYLQKYDIDPTYDGLYWHQYMQNLCAPSNESRKIKNAYANAGMMNEAFVFLIPVYEDMPNDGKEENSRQFVQRLYDIVLGRACTEEESAGWVELLSNDKSGCTEIAAEFIFSEEFTSKNISREEYIKVLYKTLLDREPAESEIQQWMQVFINGYSRKYIFQQFSTAPEFAELCDSYGLIVGSITLSESEIYDNSLAVEGATSFVQRLYNIVLGRVCTAEESAGWIEALSNGALSCTEIANGFVFSEEFVSKNVGREDYIKILYRTLLNREPAESEIQSWITVFNGGYSRKYVFKQFSIAPEFEMLCKEYGLLVGNIDLPESEVYDTSLAEQGASLFVQRLYNIVLGRACTEDESAGWIEALRSGQISCTEIGVGFVFSEEFVSKNLSDVDYVKVLYKTLINREPAETEIQIWVNAFNQGYSRKYIFQQFTIAPEFEALCKAYGLSVGSIILDDSEIYK